jgi:hypothetical protein
MISCDRAKYAEVIDDIVHDIDSMISSMVNMISCTHDIIASGEDISYHLYISHQFYEMDV